MKRFVGCTALVACGGDVSVGAAAADTASSGVESSDGGDAESGDASESGDDGGGSDNEVPPRCEVALDTIDDARILAAARIDCSHANFGDYGIAVATVGDAAFVATTDFDRTWVFRVTPRSVEPLPELPSRLAAQRVLLAVDADDRLVLAGVGATTENDTRIDVLRLGERWRRREITLPARGGVLVDIDATSEGDLALWAWTDDEAPWIARETAGAWAFGEAFVPDGAHEPRFTLDADGNAVAIDHYLGFELDDWELRARTADGPTQTLAQGVGIEPGALLPTRSAAEVVDDAAPRFAALTSAAGPLSLDSTEAHVTLLGTDRLVPICSTTYDGYDACPGPCHDASAGRLEDAVALARTADGTVWTAHIWADLDRDVWFETFCDDIKGSCTCDVRVEDEASTYALRILATGTDGMTRTELELPLDSQPGGQPAASGHVLDMSARGSRIALASMTDNSAIDVLLLDVGDGDGLSGSGE